MYLDICKNLFIRVKSNKISDIFDIEYASIYIQLSFRKENKQKLEKKNFYFPNKINK